MRLRHHVLIGLLLCWCWPALALPVQVVKSSQGITAWLVEDHTVPVVTMKFAFRGGVEQDPADAEGLSALLADMLTEGAGSRDAEQYQQALADHGVSFGVEAGRDVMDGALRSLNRELPAAVELARAALLQPHFHADDIERVKQQHLGVIKARLADPEWQARRALFLAIFPHHPYAYRSFGTEQSLARLTRAALAAEHGRRFARDNLLVSVVGDIGPERVRQVLDRIFGALPAHAVLRPVPDVQAPDEGATVQVRQEGGQAVLLFAAPGLRRDDPDWHAGQVMNYILGGGGFSSRLMDDVRDKRGLTYGISTSLSAMEHTGILMGQAMTANAKAGEAWDVTRQVWRDMAEHGATAAEIQAAKSYLIGAQATSFTSTGAIAGVLAEMQEEKLPPDYLDRRPALLNAVTPDDVRRVAQRLLDPARLTLIAVGQPQGLHAERVQDFEKE